MNIKVLLTCFNRKDQTISCLTSLYEVNHRKESINIKVFLTDDGCTDGTAQAVMKQFDSRDITIIQGDGNLYWAGGMRAAWKCAIDEPTPADYYLLLNDDTDLLPNLFEELFDTEEYCKQTYGVEGVISGVTSGKINHDEITYGGKLWDNKLLGISHRVIPEDNRPVLCDAANANILLVPQSVVEKIGTFWNGFIHGCADYEYTDRARRSGFPVLLTGNICGRCDRDHDASEKEKMKMLLSMNLQERKKFFFKPNHSIKDYLNYVKRTTPLRYPLVFIGRYMNIYFPHLYYGLGSWRDK